MSNSFNVRFEKITLKNFKNVKKGTVDFVKTDNTDFTFKPSILGIYGQNGSGKTTLVQVIEIIKFLLMGQSLPSSRIDMISVDSKNSEICAEFVISDNKFQKYSVKYFVQLEKYYETIENTLTSLEQNKKIPKLAVSKEVLSASYIDLDKKIKTPMKPIIDYDYYSESESTFLPNTKFASLTNNSKVSQNNLLISKKVSHDSSKSFIFCIETLKEFRDNYRNSDKKDASLIIIEHLVRFANGNLFVFGTKNIGLINLNAALPFVFKFEDNNHMSVGNIAIKLTSVSDIPKEAYDLVSRAINSMNTVLVTIIPNLTVQLEIVGTQYAADGNEFVQVQLYSNRNGKKISMANESEGIKKLVSILQLLIVMYNNPSTTVAIDELDSGIFEYLLGELLRIISKHAKGQLIFTSHNLRALETMDKKFVYFTTTNEENRYVKMSYVAKNNNLRDFYFHEILLGGQKEELYEETNNGAIALAFCKAGDSVES